MSLLGVQGKLSDVDVNSIEAKLTEVTNRYNDAKRKIDEAKERLAASQREADNLKDNADTLVCSLILIP
jgi:chromosome segregation ATPase